MPKIHPILVSHSINNLADYCMRKFELFSLYGNRPKRESGYAADVGTALHDGVQAFLIADADGHDDYTARFRGYMAFLAAFPYVLEAEQKQSNRSFNNAVLLLEMLFNSPIWQDYELVRVDGHGWAVEVPFIIRHTTVPGVIHSDAHNKDFMFVTQGKIDMIMRHRVTGKIITLDLKTTVLRDDMWEGEYKFSGQQIGYSHVVHAMLGIQPEEFEVAYIVASFGTEIPSVELLQMEKPEELIADYWRTQLDRLYRVKGYIEQDWFPRRNGGCVSWAHTCNAIDVCHRRDHEFVMDWFRAIESEPIETYDYWVELEL